MIKQAVVLVFGRIFLLSLFYACACSTPTAQPGRHAACNSGERHPRAGLSHYAHDLIAARYRSGLDCRQKLVLKISSSDSIGDAAKNGE